MSHLFNNVLILSPHMDDCVLGCGGLVSGNKASQIHVRYYNAIHPSVDYWAYINESRKVSQQAKFEVSVSSLVGVNRLDLYPIAEFITDIENIINKLKPDTVFIPDSSHNQDHRVIFDAALTAMRPHDTNWFINNILIYEQTEYMTKSFIPNLYVPIDINKKLDLFAVYETQQRGHRKPEHIRSLANLRGMQCNQEYAEAFQAVRITI